MTLPEYVPSLYEVVVFVLACGGVCAWAGYRVGRDGR